MILTTSEEPDLSAKCVYEQVRRSELNFDIPIAIGETLPPYSERGAVCGVPGFIGFALKDTCKDVVVPDDDQPIIQNGVEYMATMLLESNRNDWTYIVIGGQTSLQKLTRNHPDAMSKIKTLVIMGGNWCTGFDAYPGVPTPTAETNISCDMKAANFVLESAANIVEFPNIYYVPIATVNVLNGNDYSLITDAASPAIQELNNINISTSHNKAANATIDFYKAWSTAARADPDLLVHLEAMKYDPATESTPQFDAVAVLVAMDIVRGKADARVGHQEFANGVHFVTNDEAISVESESGVFMGETPPKAAYSLWSGNEKMAENSRPISNRCKDLTPYTLSPKEESSPVAIQAALGFVSNETEQDFFHEMALRMSGRLLSIVVDTTIAIESDSTNIENNISSVSSTTMTTSSKVLELRGSQFLELVTNDSSLVA